MSLASVRVVLVFLFFLVKTHAVVQSPVGGTTEPLGESLLAILVLAEGNQVNSPD